MTAAPIARLQRRTIGVLVAGQVLGGVGIGAAFSVGALLVARVAGESLSGFATTSTTLGAAAAAIPLARLAARHGRGPALATGALLAGVGAAVVVTASVLHLAPLLFAGLVLLGCSTAANLQARFAAADLADERHRGRDLSIVVWSTTIGAVAGPNLSGAGESLGAALQLPPLTGPFLFPVVSQVLAALLLISALRPDPLRTARALAERSGADDRPERADAAAPAVGQAPLGDAPPLTVARPGRIPPGARAAIALVALSHATMVAVMSMTPLHCSTTAPRSWSSASRSACTWSACTASRRSSACSPTAGGGCAPPAWALHCCSPPWSSRRSGASAPDGSWSR